MKLWMEEKREKGYLRSKFQTMACKKKSSDDKQLFLCLIIILIKIAIIITIVKGKRILFSHMIPFFNYAYL